MNPIVLTGSSGVGKSTLAKELQEALLPEPWLHFSVDTVFYCLPRSIVAQVDQLNDGSQLDSKAIVTAAHACVATLLKLGHRVIFDTVILAERGAQNMLRAFEEFDPLVVQLTCSWDQIRERTLARGDRTLEEAEHGYKHAGSHLVPHLSFDTTNSGADDIARHIASQLRSNKASKS